MRYDPVRWVCQCKSSLCDGIFYVYDEARPCPLWPYCKGQKHQLEYLYPQQSVYQRKLHLAEPERYMPHAKRALDLRRAFVPDEVRRLNQASYERNKDKRAAITKRERAEASLSEERRLRTDIPLPPCGMACEDEDGCCPYDDDCHYPNWEEEQIELAKQAKTKARNREAYARLKANPEKLAAERAKENARRRRARAAKAEAAGRPKPPPLPDTPEQREAKRAAKNERDRLRHAARMASDPEYAARCHAKNAAAYAAMTPEQREAKRAAERERDRQKRAAETPEEREARRAANRERDQQKRAAETPEEREARLEKHRETLRRSRAKKTPEQLELQRAKEREARRAKVAAMTPEERAEANAKQRARYWMRKNLSREKESEG